MRRSGVLLVLGLLAGGASAADLEVEVVDERGKPIADAVVSLHSHAGLDTGPGAAQTKTIDQHALQFDPYVQLFHPGDSVVFRNSDRTRHHVYSFSPIKAFETMVSPGESSTPMQLDTPGVVAVGCNIHDRMVTYLVVTDAPFAARTGADGFARFATVPDGTWAVRAWHPRQKPAKETNEQSLTLAATATATTDVRLRFELALRPDARQPDPETSTY